MEKIDTEVLKELQKMSKLSLSGAEEEEMKQHLENMAGYLEILKQIPQEVSPLVHPLEQFCEFRKDQITNQDGRKGILQNAPWKKEDFLVVPNTTKREQL